MTDFVVELWTNNQIVAVFGAIVLLGLIATLTITVLRALGGESDFIIGVMGSLGLTVLLSLVILAKSDGQIPGEAWAIAVILLVVTGVTALGVKNSKGLKSKSPPRDGP